jgi:hypothetical protein
LHGHRRVADPKLQLPSLSQGTFRILVSSRAKFEPSLSKICSESTELSIDIQFFVTFYTEINEIKQIKIVSMHTFAFLVLTYVFLCHTKVKKKKYNTGGRES